MLFDYNCAVKVKELRDGRESRLFWFGLILCTLYQSYRYPLQINSTGTSPTYSDTPPLLNAGKYILAFPLFAVATVRCLRKRAMPSHWLLVLATLFLSSYPLTKLLGDSEAKYIDLSFWTVFSLVLAWAVDFVSVRAIDRYLRYLLICALGSTVIEVFLFIAFGRLPALAFEGTYFIRFGGFLDDPNGFAAILFLIMGWAYGRFRGRTRFFILASIVICLILTQSWTGLAFLILVAFLWGLVGISRRPVLAILIICATSIVAGFVMHAITQSPTEIVDEVLTAKQGSIEGHLFPLEKVAARWAEWSLVGSPTYSAYESWWAGALVNFGAPWYFAWLALIAALIISLKIALAKADCEAKPVYLGFFLFGCYFAFGSISLPYPIIFPVNFFFFLFSFLVAFGKIRLKNGLPSIPDGGPRQRRKSSAILC